MFDELSRYLANDPQCTAVHLDVLFSPRHASLYRFGVVGGQAVAYRQLGLVADATFAEIRHYGQEAEVPEELWSELTRQPHPGDAEEIARAATAILERIDNWFAGHD